MPLFRLFLNGSDTNADVQRVCKRVEIRLAINDNGINVLNKSKRKKI